MRWLSLICIPLTLSCGDSPEPKVAAAPGACAAAPQLAPLSLEEGGSQPYQWPTSHVGGSLTLSSSLVENLLQRSVPEVVAEGRNVSAGAAGRTTFQIKRQKPRVTTNTAGLTVSVKLDGEIQLCKPFGGVCIGYGTCRPEWLAVASVHSPWQLSREPEVDLNVKITKGCVLSPVKVDVTSELKKVTDAEVAKLRNRMKREIGRVHDELTRQAAQGVQQLRAADGVCLGLRVDEVTLALSEDHKSYVVNFEAAGRLSLDCASEPSEATRHSALGPLLAENARLTTRDSLTGETELHVDTAVPLAALTAELQTRFPQRQVRLTRSNDDFLVEVEGWRGCPSGWALVRPTMTGAAVELAPRGTSDPALITALGTSAVLAQARETHATRVAHLLTGLSQPLRLSSTALSNKALPTDLVIHPQPSLSGGQASVVGAPGALVLRTTLRGRLAANLTPAP